MTAKMTASAVEASDATRTTTDAIVGQGASDGIVSGPTPFETRW
jgi:hypothetical protein